MNNLIDPAMPSAKKKWPWMFALSASVLIAFAPALANSFVNYDDPFYVLNNPLNADGSFWQAVFLRNQAGNWHPLTMLSHALDLKMFGLVPLGHHLVSILWHLLNTLLLFVFLRRFNRDSMWAFLLSALWALHPLQVQSVAWVSERKNLLSHFFFMLGLLLWDHYKRNPKKMTYFWCLLVFVCGLASKASVIVFPGVLLLFDVYPYGEGKPFWKRFRLVEKVPFMLLAGLIAWITLHLQHESRAVIQQMTPLLRITHPIESYGQYMLQCIYPLKLSVVYAMTTHVNAVAFWLSLCMLILVSVGCWIFRSRQPWLGVGWCFFLGCLVPVIGVVKAGISSHADRYMYLPMVGLCLMAAGVHLPEKLKSTRSVLLCILPLLGLIYFTQREVRVWKTTETLFRAAVQRTDKNWYAIESLGVEYLNRHQPQRALPLFKKVLSWSPDNASVARFKARSEIDLGRLDEAQSTLEMVEVLEPDNPETWAVQALLLMGQKKFEPAQVLIERVLDAAPNRAEYYEIAGRIMLAQGKMDEAQAFAEQGLRFSNSPELIMLKNTISSFRNPKAQSD